MKLIKKMNLISDYFIFLKILFLSHFKKRRLPSVSINMKTAKLTRRLSMICSILRACGYELEISILFDTYRVMNKYGRRLFSDSHIYLGYGNRFTNFQVVDFENSSDNKKIIVDYNLLGKEPTNDDLYLPIMFHPNILFSESYHQAKILRATDFRKIGVLFAGNFNKDSYSKAITFLSKDYISRFDVLTTIIKTGLAEPLNKQMTVEEFLQKAESGAYYDSCVIINTEEFKIPQDRWLSILAMTRFFISPPGYRQPFCHNIIEAMAVGAIPITQYGNLFRPLLRDGKECLSYDNLGDLIYSVRRALNMSENERSRLSAAAATYHDEYLSLDFAKNKIKEFEENKTSNRMRLFLAGAS